MGACWQVGMVGFWIGGASAKSFSWVHLAGGRVRVLHGTALAHFPMGACWQVGVVGFCMGGALSLLAAEHAKVDCAVSFYGTPVGHKELSHVRHELSSTPRAAIANSTSWCPFMCLPNDAECAGQDV